MFTEGLLTSKVPHFSKKYLVPLGLHLLLTLSLLLVLHLCLYKSLQGGPKTTQQHFLSYFHQNDKEACLTYQEMEFKKT